MFQTDIEVLFQVKKYPLTNILGYVFYNFGPLILKKMLVYLDRYAINISICRQRNIWNHTIFAARMHKFKAIIFVQILWWQSLLRETFWPQTIYNVFDIGSMTVNILCLFKVFVTHIYYIHFGFLLIFNYALFNTPLNSRCAEKGEQSILFYLSIYSYRWIDTWIYTLDLWTLENTLDSAWRFTPSPRIYEYYTRGASSKQILATALLLYIN